MADGCFPFKRPSWMPSDSSPSSAEAEPGSRLTRLLRSKSDTAVDVKRSSYKLMTSLSDMDVRRSSDRRQSASSTRRYRRVLRDVAAGDSFLDHNPHVVHRFSKEYRDKHNIDKVSGDQFSRSKSLPYEVTGPTILKKPLIFDEGGLRTAANRPTISFEDEVQVIEYDKKEKVKVKSLRMRRIQLTMDEDVKCMVSETESDPEKENCRNQTSTGSDDVLQQWE